MRFTEIYYKAGKEKFYVPEMQAEISPEDVNFTYIGRTGMYRKIKKGEVQTTTEARYYREGDKVQVLKNGKDIIREIQWDSNAKEDLKDRDFKYSLIIYGVTSKGIPIKLILSGIGIGNSFEAFNRIYVENGKVPVVSVLELFKTTKISKYKGPRFTVNFKDRELTDKEKEVLEYYNEKFPYTETSNKKNKVDSIAATAALFGGDTIKPEKVKPKEIIEEDDDLPF